MRSPKIFISYTHDSDLHMQRVLELSDRLRSDGVDSNLDQYETSPPEGWPAWMRKQIKEADFVLLICTERYISRYEGLEETGKGAGAKWEGAIISQELYEAEGKNSKFIPVVFAHEETKSIPLEMRRGTYYVMDSDARYDDLYGHLTDQPKTVKRELGELRRLPQNRLTQPSASVTSETPPNANIVVAPVASDRQGPLVLLIQPGATELFVQARQIRARENRLKLSVLPLDPRQVAAIKDLQRNSREPIGIAYNLTALFVRLKAIEQIVDKEEVWELEFEEDEYATRGSVQFSMIRYSLHEIAEMRARRILLNEELEKRSNGRSDFDRKLVEHSIQGGYDSKFEVLSSPLPKLYSQFRTKREDFLEAARLYSVLLLLLTHTVDHILRLDLQFKSNGVLGVDFEGTRPPQYTNETALMISVKGTCELQE